MLFSRVRLCPESIWYFVACVRLGVLRVHALSCAYVMCIFFSLGNIGTAQPWWLGFWYHTLSENCITISSFVLPRSIFQVKCNVDPSYSISSHLVSVRKSIQLSCIYTLLVHFRTTQFPPHTLVTLIGIAFLSLPFSLSRPSVIFFSFGSSR